MVIQNYRKEKSRDHTENMLLKIQVIKIKNGKKKINKILEKNI